jgi:hypothetical protein
LLCNFWIPDESNFRVKVYMLRTFRNEDWSTRC